MPGLNDINFIRTPGIGGVDPVESHISALLFYSDNLPSGFSTSDRIKAITGISQAEALGILNDFADETKATNGTIQITTPGATDEIQSALIGGAVIGSYTVEAGDAANDVAAGLDAAINASTGDHGFTSSVTTDTVTIVAPNSIGKALSSFALTFSTTGTGAATVVDFVSTGANGSYFAYMHYHISEFFRQKSDGKLYVGIYGEGTFDGTGIAEIIDYANGEVRRIGVFEVVEPFATSQLSAIQSILVTKRNEHKPASASFTANFANLAVNTLPNLTSATASKVAVNFGEDGNFLYPAYINTQSYVNGDKITWLDGVYICIANAKGKAPFNTSYWTRAVTNLRAVRGHSISTLGNQIGTKAGAALSQDIAEVGAFNLTSGQTLSEAGLATGELFKNTAKGTLNNLADKNYIFLRNFEGRQGVYYTDSYTAVSRSSDYNSIERNEVMDEAERLTYRALLPRLNSRIILANNGTIDRSVINDFRQLMLTALGALTISGDISGDPIVTIDPNQNIAQTSKLNTSFSIQPVGIARNIEVNNSYTVNT